MAKDDSEDLSEIVRGIKVLDVSALDARGVAKLLRTRLSVREVEKELHIDVEVKLDPDYVPHLSGIRELINAHKLWQGTIDLRARQGESTKRLSHLLFNYAESGIFDRRAYHHEFVVPYVLTKGARCEIQARVRIDGPGEDWGAPYLGRWNLTGVAWPTEPSTSFDLQYETTECGPGCRSQRFRVF